MGDELTPAADGRYLRALLDKPFTDRQLEIVTADLQPQLVIAGAGLGQDDGHGGADRARGRLARGARRRRPWPDVHQQGGVRACRPGSRRPRCADATRPGRQPERSLPARARRPADGVDLSRLRRVPDQGPRLADRARARLASVERGRTLAAGAADRTSSAWSLLQLELDAAHRRRASPRARCRDVRAPAATGRGTGVRRQGDRQCWCRDRCGESARRDRRPLPDSRRPARPGRTLPSTQVRARPGRLR